MLVCCTTGASGFVRDSRNKVDESATIPKEQSLFVKDRAAARKVRDTAACKGVSTCNWPRTVHYMHCNR